MTNKERCDKCKFYKGPPNAFQPLGYHKPPPSSAPPVHRNMGSCHVAEHPAEVRPNFWCEKFEGLNVDLSEA